MQILSSAHHIEMNPADAGTADRLVIQDVLKEIAQSPPVVDSSKGGGRTFKVVVLSEVDFLSRGAQQSLRRTMEKYMRCCRLVLCCESLSRVFENMCVHYSGSFDAHRQQGNRPPRGFCGPLHEPVQALYGLHVC